MATSMVPLPTLGKETTACISKGDKAADKAEQFYKAAGIKLAEAKVRIKKDKSITWSDYLRIHCDGLSRQRANEYVMISDGRQTVAEQRAIKNESSKKSHAKTREKARGVNCSVDNQSKLPKEINRSVSTGDITEADIGANLWQACQAIELYEGQPDWKAVAKELTKKQLDCLVAAIEEMKAHV